MMNERACDEFRTVAGLLQQQCRQYGKKLAFRYLLDGKSDPVEVTYESLDRQARRIASQLRARCQAGDRALLVYPPGLEFIAGFFGCIYSGTLAVPVLPPRPFRQSARVEAIVRHAQPSVVLSTRDLQSRASRQLAQVPELLALPWLVTDASSDGANGEWSDWEPDESDIAFLQYTSGSTGQPKGVMVSHRNLLHNLAAIQRAYGTQHDGHGVCWLPLYHDMGLIGGVLETLYAGGASTLLSPVAVMQNPLLWLQTISETRASFSGGPDFAYHLCCGKIGKEDRADLDLSCWKVAYTGAEPVRATTIDQFCETFGPCGFRREAFLPCYGLAEATLMVSSGDASQAPIQLHCRQEPLTSRQAVEADEQDSETQTLIGCGQTLAGQRILIVDPETKKECEPSQIGEIWVCGPSIATGYFRDESATETSFRARLAGSDEGPFLRTGDLGFLRDGELFVVGRLKDVIILCGRNYYPDDLEWSIQNCHSRLRPYAGAAFSVEINGREELVVAHEVDRHRRDLDVDAVTTAVRDAVIAEHEVIPYNIVLLKAGGIPRTSSGKVQRHSCREQFLADQLDPVGLWTRPSSNGDENAQGSDGDVLWRHAKHSPNGEVTREKIQSWLVQRLSTRLGVPAKEIQVDRPFAEFGMSSVQAVALTDDLQKWIGQPVSPTFFYNYPTVAALAAHLAEVRSPPSSTATPATPNEEHDKLVEEVGELSDEAIASLISQEFGKLK
jgi:acyl-CoA synthetase (AMP-forming)/AMP-acid ligase II/acyl carrier protein